MPSGRRAHDGARGIGGFGQRLAADELLADAPEARRAADAAADAAEVGEFVRELRTRAGMSQDKLAAETGMTQAHLSELERGLGANGPTVATLARIVRHLGDTLMIDTRRRQAERERRLIAIAEAWVGEAAETLGVVAAPGGLGQAVAGLSRRVAKGEDDNPFRRVLVEGVLTGVYLALRALPGRPAAEMEAVREALGRPSGIAGHVIGHLERG